MTTSTFQTRLRALIDAMGVTDSRFAALVGMSQGMLCNILSGKHDPSFKTLQKIHEKVGADIQYLMGERE